jgi:TatD DNase family protein
MSGRAADAHCHLDFDSFDKDREEVIEKCSEELELVVNSGRDPETNQESLELQKGYSDFIYATAGIHPTHTEAFDQVGEVRKQLEDSDFCAVGEIGMDYHHVEEEEMREKQEEVFVEMVETAEEINLPVVVHSRNAEKQVLEVLKDRDVDCYLHCFNGSVSQAETAVEQDMLIGVTYQIVYSSRVQSIVEAVPLENLVLETDSPFLKQGERNTPLTVNEVAEEIAEIKDIPVSKVKAITTENSREIFSL